MDAKQEQNINRLRVDQSYASADADLILQSCDGMHFHVYSTILKVASGFFRDMLSLPRAREPKLHADAGVLADVVVMDERKEVLKALLDAIYPDSTTVLAEMLDFETFRDVMFILIHKYEFVAGEKIAKGLINDKRLAFSPILMFGVMQHIGWEEEARAQSTSTLELNLYSKASQEELRKLATRSALDLIFFHQMRRKKISDTLESADWCNLEPESKCREHASGLCYQPVWYAFKEVVMEELEQNPSGRALQDITTCLPDSILTELKRIHVYCQTCVPTKAGQILSWSNFCDKFEFLIDNLPVHYADM